MKSAFVIAALDAMAREFSRRSGAGRGRGQLRQSVVAGALVTVLFFRAVVLVVVPLDAPLLFLLQ